MNFKNTRRLSVGKRLTALLLLLCMSASLLVLTSCDNHDHSWGTVATVDLAPSCTEDGRKSIKCAVCQKSKSSTTVTIPALGHLDANDDRICDREGCGEECWDGFDSYEYDVSTLTPLGGTIRVVGNGTEYALGSRKRGTLIDLTEMGYNVVTITGRGNVGFDYTFLSALPVDGETPAYATGYYGITERRNDKSVSIEIPEDASYLYLTYESGATPYLPSSIVFTAEDALKAPLEALQSGSAEKYDYPLHAIQKGEGTVLDTNGVYTVKSENGNTTYVAFIDITGSTYDTVRVGLSQVYKNLQYTFLTKVPALGETLQYAMGYSAEKMPTVFNEDHPRTSETEGLLRIPENAACLALLYTEETLSEQIYKGPSYVVFEGQNHNSTPVETDKKVLLISIDGLRPDALQKSPYFSQLASMARYSMTAETIYPSVTLPAHTSMFHGVSPTLHGVTDNDFTPKSSLGSGLTEVLVNAGRSCAMFYDWKTLEKLTRIPSQVKMTYNSGSRKPAGMEKYQESADLSTAAAIEHITSSPTDFTFLYYGLTDEMGHTYAWMSDKYTWAIDYVLANVLRVLEVVGDEYVVIITADHGGGGEKPKDHGSSTAEDMTIPLLIIGEGYEAGTLFEGDLSILDVAPTVAELLGVCPKSYWEGDSLAVKEN